MARGGSNYLQNTVVLNDYNGSTISQRTRTSKKTGKSSKRVSFEIKAEPLVHMFDDEALGRGPAEALKSIIGRQIRDIKSTASMSTLRRRKASQKAFQLNRMSDSDEKRYSGGRIGDLEPNQTVRLFNDSGRLGGNLAVGKNRQAAGERDWVINVPANRFTDDTSHLAKQLFDLVPALGKPSTLAREPEFVMAVNESIGLIIAKAENAAAVKRVRLKQARLNAARALIGLGRALTGI